MVSPEDETTREAVDVMNSPALSDRSQANRDIHAIVEQIFSTEKGLLAKSVLSQDQVVMASAALVIAEELGSLALASFVRDLLEMEISRGGYGRKNLTDVLAAIANREDQHKDERSFMRKMFGGPM